MEDHPRSESPLPESAEKPIARWTRRQDRWIKIGILALLDFLVACGRGADAVQPMQQPATTHASATSTQSAAIAHTPATIAHTLRLEVGALSSAERRFRADATGASAAQPEAMLEHTLARYKAIVGLDEIERDLPTDLWRDESSIGHTNRTRFEREIRAAHVALQAVRDQMRIASSDKIARSLIVVRPPIDGINASGVAYYVFRDGNRLLTDELAARGKASAAALLLAHEPTDRLFTGSEGPNVPAHRGPREESDA